MSTQTRIYTITDKKTKVKRLVRSTHPNGAYMLVARDAYDVRVATQNDLEELLPPNTVHGVHSPATAPVVHT